MVDRKSILLIIIEALVFIGILKYFTNQYESKIDVYEHNIEVSNGKIEQLELKNGELIKVRDSYILDKQELQEKFNMSKKELKDLQNKLNSSLAYISKIESNINIDTVFCTKDSIIYIDNKVSEIRFKYKDDWFNLEGTTIDNNGELSTLLYNININTPIKIGIADNYKLFVQSPNPYINFTDIDASVVNGSNFYQKPKQWSYGLHGGFGMGYDIISKQLSLGPYVGIGIQYNF